MTNCLHGGDKKHLLQKVLSVSNRKGYSYVGTSQAQHISLGIVWSSCPPSAEGHWVQQRPTYACRRRWAWPKRCEQSQIGGRWSSKPQGTSPSWRCTLSGAVWGVQHRKQAMLNYWDVTIYDSLIHTVDTVHTVHTYSTYSSYSTYVQCIQFIQYIQYIQYIYRHSTYNTYSTYSTYSTYVQYIEFIQHIQYIQYIEFIQYIQYLQFIQYISYAQYIRITYECVQPTTNTNMHTK